MVYLSVQLFLYLYLLCASSMFYGCTLSMFYNSTLSMFSTVVSFLGQCGALVFGSLVSWYILNLLKAEVMFHVRLSLRGLYLSCVLYLVKADAVFPCESLFSWYAPYLCIVSF